jgi:hypothetical protein
MEFIERELFHDKRRNLTVYKRSWSILYAQSRDDIYWREIFNDKRRNLKVYEIFQLILFARTRDDISWRGAIPR